MTAVPRRGRDLTGKVFERRALALFVVCHAVSGNSIPNPVDERLRLLLKNFAAGCKRRFMQGYGKVPASAHSAYIGVYVFAASTERCNPLQAIRSLPGHPTGGPSRGALRLLRSSCAPSCDFASQSSSLRSSGNLTPAAQVHHALGQPDAFGAGEFRRFTL